MDITYEILKSIGTLSTRAEGWACDYYDINGVMISTGYAPIAPKNSRRDYDTTRKYDDQAREIISNYGLTWQQRKEQVNALLAEYVKEMTK